MPQNSTSTRPRCRRSTPTGASGWSISREDACHVYQNLHVQPAAWQFLLAHSVSTSPGRGPYPASSHRNFQSPPADPLGHTQLVHLQEDACHASRHRHTHNAAGRLLPAHLVGSLPGRTHATSTNIGKPSPRQGDSYRLILLVYHPGGALTPPPYIGTSKSPPADSLRRTQLLHLQGGPISRLPTSTRPLRRRATSTGVFG